MTAEEIICEFMEARPETRSGVGDNTRWWRACYYLVSQDETVTSYRAQPLDLDCLHEVEARLTGEQWTLYYDHLWATNYGQEHPTWRFLIHASAPQKIAALAKVIGGGG